MVDDFEDGDDKPLIPGGWYSYTDSPDGKSTLTFTGAPAGAIAMNGPGYQSQKSLEVSFAFDRGTLTYDPYVGWGVSLATAANPIDLSAYSGIAYDYLGSAHRPRVENANVTDYDEFGANLPASASWKSVTLPFTSLAQEGWGKKVAFDPSRCTNISFAARGASGTPGGTVQVDNLRLVKNIGKGSPNMSVNPASPPADGTLPTLEITNPLQAKAMQYLTRGYNITNWLEQEPFAGTFTYDEAFVAQLAQAGFKSLRLPIDLDNYVASKTGTGDTLSLTVTADLFTILDSFDTWTKAHGLSLTIDYHQYSTLLNKADPDSIGTAVQLWGKVAEHFAANPREDIFFELCNEPELAFDADPTAVEWTAVAERMIAAIRATDQTHSVIFGDVQWYGIDTLAQRAVLSDTNVIYAFHDYDPFIFTHEGAGWTALASVHELPYPYTPERWSQYYADLGFSPFMESWILGAAQNYYRDGSKAALRNHILAAKRWAVTNNVPVICNEFGAYDGTSLLEDRVRYYTDVISIFEELAIPWQHWFMIMNASGTVTPAEYATAMHLGQ